MGLSSLCSLKTWMLKKKESFEFDGQLQYFVSLPFHPCRSLSKAIFRWDPCSFRLDYQLYLVGICLKAPDPEKPYIPWFSACQLFYGSFIIIKNLGGICSSNISTTVVPALLVDLLSCLDNGPNVKIELLMLYCESLLLAGRCLFIIQSYISLV